MHLENIPEGRFFDGLMKGLLILFVIIGGTKSSTPFLHLRILALPSALVMIFLLLASPYGSTMLIIRSPPPSERLIKIRLLSS